MAGNIPFLANGLLRPVKRLGERVINSGLSSRKLALTLALGITIGILPVLWGTTLLCLVAAALFRLNQVAIQAVNYLVYPIQLALLIPFFRLGERFFPGSIAVTVKGYSGPFYAFLARGGLSNIKAIGAWGIVAPFLAITLYSASQIIFSGRLHSLIRRRHVTV